MIEYNVYSKINNFHEMINANCKNLTNDEVDIIIDEFENLQWNYLYDYYKKSNRQNLLCLEFILHKIIFSSKRLKHLKNNFNSNDFKKYDNGLQNMLWEILNPDFIELS